MRVWFPASAASDALVVAITGRVAKVQAPKPEPSPEVRREEEQRAMSERAHHALLAAARECAARGEVLDVVTWEREVVRTKEIL
jgi:hypothetical protein